LAIKPNFWRKGVRAARKIGCGKKLSRHINILQARERGGSEIGSSILDLENDI